MSLRAVIIYCAGSPVQLVEERLAASGLRHRLLSYADLAHCEAAPNFWMRPSRPAGSRVFLDSGAFSVRSRGTDINIGSYCDYIEFHRDAINTYAVLDVIGDWQSTARNLVVMHKRGLSPLPVFHRGSPWRELERLAAEYGCIGLGGLAPTCRQQVQPFLDLVFYRLQRHWPVRVHVFGMTAQWALQRYPLYSADSSTAIVGGGMGRVLSFRYGQIESRHWREQVRVTLDAAVADHLGPRLAANGSAHIARKCRSVAAVIALESYVTALWRRRGIRWDGWQ